MGWRIMLAMMPYRFGWDGVLELEIPESMSDLCMSVLLSATLNVYCQLRQLVLHASVRK